MLCVRHNCSIQDVNLDKLMRTKSVTGLFNYHIGIHVSLCNMKQKQVLTFSSFFTYLQKLWLQLLREHGSSILHPLHTDWVIITQKQDIQPIAYHMGQSRRFTRRSSACFVLLHSTRSTFDAIFPAQLGFPPDSPFRILFLVPDRCDYDIIPKECNDSLSLPSLWRWLTHFSFTHNRAYDKEGRHLT